MGPRGPVQGHPRGPPITNGGPRVEQHFEEVEAVAWQDQLRFTDHESFMWFTKVGHNYCCGQQEHGPVGSVHVAEQRFDTTSGSSSAVTGGKPSAARPEPEAQALATG
jgi:hypothetical protein